MADPVAVYHYVNNKIHTGSQEDDSYSGAEMARDLALMILAAKTLIQHNVRLSEHALKCEKAAEDAQVDLLSKDIEIHELKEALAQNGHDLPRD